MAPLRVTAPPIDRTEDVRVDDFSSGVGMPAAFAALPIKRQRKRLVRVRVGLRCVNSYAKFSSKSGKSLLGLYHLHELTLVGGAIDWQQCSRPEGSGSAHLERVNPMRMHTPRVAISLPLLTIMMFGAPLVAQESNALDPNAAVVATEVASSAVPNAVAVLPDAPDANISSSMGLSADGQQAAMPPSGDAGAATKPALGPGEVEINGRLFPRPLTTGEKWQRYAKYTFASPGIFLYSAVSAGYNQATNYPEGWGTDASSFGKRFGSSYTGFVIQTTVYTAGTTMLGNEGRYIHCQCQGFWHRSGYALAMTFLTYHDHHKVLDISQFAGAYAGGMIPVLWYPDHYSPLVQGVQSGHIQMGWAALTRQFQEFTPELNHMFHGVTHHDLPDSVLHD